MAREKEGKFVGVRVFEQAKMKMHARWCSAEANDPPGQRFMLSQSVESMGEGESELDMRPNQATSNQNGSFESHQTSDTRNVV